jgi:aldose 1-epimerase
LVLGKVKYTLAPYTWNVEIEAEAKTHDTPLMLTNHAYWNLDAFANPNSNTSLTHTLSMPFSRRRITFNDEGLPDGRIPAVPEGDINDFWSEPKLVGAASSEPEWVGNCVVGLPGYDCEWVQERIADSDEELIEAPVASLWSDWSGIRLDLYSAQEGLVVTSCGFFPEDTLPVKETQGGPATNGFIPTSGCIAIEPMDWIDGINQPEWDRRDKQIYGPDSGKYVNNIQWKFSILDE